MIDTVLERAPPERSVLETRPSTVGHEPGMEARPPCASIVLTVFNHLWAIAGLCEWTRWTFTETGWSWMLLVSAGAPLPGAERHRRPLATFAGLQGRLHRACRQSAVEPRPSSWRS